MDAVAKTCIDVIMLAALVGVVGFLVKVVGAVTRDEDLRGAGDTAETVGFLLVIVALFVRMVILILHSPGV